MNLEKITVVQPVGCRAAVVEETTRIRGGFLDNDQVKTEVQIICGARTNRVSDTQTLGFLEGADLVDRGRADLGRKVSEVMTAMCLGCEFNSNRAETQVEITPIR